MDPPLSQAEVELIQASWATVSALPATTVGGLLFKHIFEQADVSALFSFGRKPGFDPSPDAVAANPNVQAHGEKVVSTVGVAVSMLSKLGELVPVLKDLGAKHTKYGVAAAHYPVVGSAFLKTLSVGLGESYTPAVAEAYTKMWGVVEATMLAGVAEAAAAERAASWGCYVSPTAEKEAETRAAQASAMGYFASGPEAWRMEEAYIVGG